MARSIEVAYGSGRTTLRLPDDADILRAPGGTPTPDPSAAVHHALRNPIGAPPLHQLVADAQPQSVAITVSDITRAVPNQSFLPAILETLNNVGVRDDRIVIVIGNGMHRACTGIEIRQIVGEETARRVEVVNHRADQPHDLVRVSDNPPVSVNRRFADADFRIVTGFIEPHFMAGYSGGRKGVCPALVDLETIQSFHGFRTLSDPNAVAGVLSGNPCHDISLSVARTVGVDFLVNVTTTHEHEMAGLFCGDLEEAHEKGCAEVDRTGSVSLDRTYDLVVTTGGGAPLDSNLYQTVKGMTMASPAVRADGGVLAILSACSEGIGSSEYRELLDRYGADWKRFMRDIETNHETTEKDQWEFQMQCKVLEQLGMENLRLFTDGISSEEQERLALTASIGNDSAPDRLQRALDGFVRERPNARIAVIPDGPYTMLRMSTAASA